MNGAEFSGLLREKIRIERPLSQRDAMGSAAGQNITIGDFWAAAEPVGLGEAVAAESRSALPRWRFTLRRTDAIAAGDRLFWSGREMVVRTVSSDHRFIPKTILQAEERR